MSIKLPVLPVCVCDTIKNEQILTLNHICECYMMKYTTHIISLYHFTNHFTNIVMLFKGHVMQEIHEP